MLAVEKDPADENHVRSIDNLRRLELAARSDAALRVVTLPFPRPVVMNGERLPASYANFYIANGVRGWCPRSTTRTTAWRSTRSPSCCPSHEVVGIHAVDLVWGLGTLHCLTQQEPAGAAPSAR